MAIRPRPTVAPAPIRIPTLRTDLAPAGRGPTALRPVTIGLPPALYEDYLAYAAAQGHPLAGLLRQILTEGLPAAIGGGGRGAAAPPGRGGVARRTP